MKKSIIAICLCCFISAAYAQLPSNLRAHYPFNGNFNDTLGINTPGVNTGSVFVTDKFNKPLRAVKFNGNNPDYINLGTDLSFSTTSIACWINPENKATDQIFLSNVYNQYQYTTTGIELRVDPTGKIVVFIGNASNPPGSWRTYTSIAKVPYNEWTHINVVIDNFTSIKVYINGDLDVSAAITGITYTKDVNRMHVAARANPPTENPYWGMVDELMIFNKALTAVEAAKVYSVSNGITAYHKSVPVNCNNPVTNGLLILQGNIPSGVERIEIINLLGEIVATYPPSENNTYDVHQLPAGMYLVKLTSQGTFSTRKVFIQQ